MQIVRPLQNWAIALIGVVHVGISSAQTSVSPAVPVEPISTILNAFQSHSLVAVAEGNHNNEQGHAFRLSLIRDPRFARTVNDIVVEFGNARYQELIDRFVRGDAAKQMKALDRDRYPADVIRREVLAKGRRALLIYGDGHLARRDILQNFAPSPFLLPQLEQGNATSVFSVWTETNVDLKTLQSDIAQWPKPSLAVLRGTALGGADVTAYVPQETPRFSSSVEGNGPDFSKPLPRAEWRALPMQAQFDAVLYLGPASDITMSRLSTVQCPDGDYMKMRFERMELAGMRRQIEQLKQHCAALVRQ